MIPRAKQDWPLVDQQQMIVLYSEGWSLREIAKVFDTSFMTVRRILLQHGVPTRPP